jgi:MFS family permease
MSRFYPSAFYLIYFAALAVFSPFLVLYYQQLGFSGGQVGLLLGVSPFLSLFASPFWTGLADARHRHKAVLTVTLVAAIVFAALYPFFRSFGPLFTVVALFSFFVAPIVALVDSATISMLGDQREMYGRVRLWGTVGWGIAAPLAGIFLQRYGLQWMFWMYSALMAINLFITRKLVFVKPASSTPFWAGLRVLLTNRRWVFFLLTVFIAGIGLSAQTNYLAVLMEIKGGDKSLLGVALFITTLSEVPIMFFSNRLLKGLKSRGLLILAIFFTGLRCLLYALVAGPVALLVLQLVHGLTFPLLWVAGVTYVAENAPEGLGATGQGVFGSVMVGFGMAAGGPLGGLLIDRMGISGMYAVFGLIVFAGLGLFLVFDRNPPRQNL